MTEARWLAWTDPRPMLEYLRGKASDRKMRLFAVAVVRSVWNDIKSPRSRKAVETAERFADGKASRRALDRAYFDAYAAQEIADAALTRLDASEVTDRVMDAMRFRHAATLTAAPTAADGAILCAGIVSCTVFGTYPEAQPALRFQAGLVRDIFGNPFRPVTFDRPRQTRHVTALAATIYGGRAFDRLPILADALEEAGCDNADILSHCRGPGQHVRGCWVVDLVTGRA
jgi:hypothetical protein